MNYKSLLLWFFIIILGMTFVLTLVAIRESMDTTNIQPLSIIVRSENYEQASRFLYTPAPFYFPFKTRATNMSSLFPFTQDFSSVGRQNSHGFRTPEYTVARPPNTFRILVLGGSMTWGDGVDLEETFSYQLSNLLNRDCSRFQTEVISLGVRGHRFADNLIKLEIFGSSLKPDLVVFQVGPSDLNFYDYYTIFHFRNPANEYSAYAAKEAEVLSKKTLDWNVFVESLEEIQRWSGIHSTPVVFVVAPKIDSSKSGENFGGFDLQRFFQVPGTSLFENVVSEIRSRGFPTLYLLDTFRKEAGINYLAVSEAMGGLNALGHRIVARSLQAFLSGSALPGCSSYHPPPAAPEWSEEKELRSEAAKNWQKYNSSYESQAQFFNKLELIYPKDPWIKFQVANVYLGWQKNPEIAFDRYSSLIKLVPAFAAPWYHMSLCAPGKAQRADLLRQLLVVVPDQTQAMLDLAKIYVTQDNITGACRLLSRILEIPRYQQQYDDTKEMYETNHCDSILRK